MENEKAIAVLEAGPLSLKEVAFERFEEFFNSIIEQSAFTEEQQQALGEHLKASIEKRDKLGSCIAWIDGQAEMIRAEEKRLAARRGSFEKFSQAIRDSLKAQLEEWGVKKVEGMKFSFAIQKNPPAVEIEDEAAIPAEFIEYKPSISKSKVKDALQDGKEVPGAKLNQSTRLVIK